MLNADHANTVVKKCDLLRPQCTQCQRYGAECPGYTRPHKFMDEGPQLRQRFHKKRYQSSSAPKFESIDERIAPSLVTQSMGNQQPVIFGSFVLTAFTRWFGLNKYRVHVPWTGYIAQHIGQSPAFDAAIYCVNSIFMGQTHHNTTLQRSSREVYSKALRLFGDRIRDANAMESTESVSITIALSLFEAYSRTNSDSWARHAAGTALLMAHRGPATHVNGFDRCLYLSFRSFLVAEAFVNNKRCIFERPEWQAHIDQIRVEDMTSSRVDGPISLFIDLQDRIFKGVVKTPGLLVQARKLHAAAEPLKASRNLAAQVLRLSQSLHTLTVRLRLAATAQSYQEGCRPSSGSQPPKFIGPIPTTFPQEFANSVLRGSEQCLLILRLLLDYLESDTIHHIPKSSYQDSVESSDPLPFRLVSNLVRFQDKNSDSSSAILAGETDVPSADKWLDLVAASMGLEAFDIVTSTSESHDLPSEDQGDTDQWNAALALR
ncbi:hypothetical protein N7462_009488 [Penicillium macrosclerotiorum]|uniref:uncharacterized protein n=1 Tax=Penicillium macrosclerotiorum TaxID=303699 RepID=UPI0025488A27|nr:uncharacterized protein N7462_009488 [Penicillium macrosclerotiorum]KAJ5674049.1 hypothetical protein N7462_009488 [Penicillium macrosclerotiorum]